MKNFVVFFSIFITFKIIIYEAHSNMNMSKNRWFMNYSKPRPVIFLWLLYDPFMQTLEKKKIGSRSGHGHLTIYKGCEKRKK